MRNLSLRRFIAFAALASAAAFAASCGSSASDGPCAPSTLRCGPGTNEVQTCGADQTWKTAKNCELEGKVCSAGQCIEGSTGDCTPGNYRCDPANPNTRQQCDATKKWVFSKKCDTEGKVCSGGTCVIPTDEDPEGGSCTAGTKQCKDATVTQVCNPSGKWEDDQDCAEFGKGCQLGKCGGCMSGATRCSPDKPTFSQKCINAEWADVIDCGTMGGGIVCDNGICRTPISDGDENEYVLEGDACASDPDCKNTNKYCFKMEGADNGICLPYCDQQGGADLCPTGYTCSTTGSLKCERIEGFCTSGAHCTTGRQFCDKDGETGWGVCKNYCYLPGESCPQLTKCCLKDDASSECAGKAGKCISTQGECSRCYSDTDCGSLNYCEKIAGQNLGCCKPKCYKNEDCPAGLTCRNDGRCGSGASGCDCDGGCGMGYVCDPLYCQCVLNCPSCAPMYCCDAAHAPNCYKCECKNPTVCGILLEQCCFGYRCSAIVYGVLGFCI